MAHADPHTATGCPRYELFQFLTPRLRVCQQASSGFQCSGHPQRWGRKRHSRKGLTDQASRSGPESAGGAGWTAPVHAPELPATGPKRLPHTRTGPRNLAGGRHRCHTGVPRQRQPPPKANRPPRLTAHHAESTPAQACQTGFPGRAGQAPRWIPRSDWVRPGQVAPRTSRQHGGPHC